MEMNRNDMERQASLPAIRRITTDLARHGIFDRKNAKRGGYHTAQAKASGLVAVGGFS
jgi:hypothetical protein